MAVKASVRSETDGLLILLRALTQSRSPFCLSNFLSMKADGGGRYEMPFLHLVLLSLEYCINLREKDY